MIMRKVLSALTVITVDAVACSVDAHAHGGGLGGSDIGNFAGEFDNWFGDHGVGGLVPS
jgi:hypothetical protein